MKISIGYPDRYSEERILEVYSKKSPIEEIFPVASANDIKNMQEAVKDIVVHRNINEYIVNIAEATRNSELLNIGYKHQRCISFAENSPGSGIDIRKGLCNP